MANSDASLVSIRLPFEGYPGQGRQLLGQIGGDNCRHGYGLRLQRLTGQTHCAYCGLDLVVSYENWLLMALDHVVPESTCVSWGVPNEWTQDASNRVLACAGCNGFRNRYTPDSVERPTTLEEFYLLRDRIFIERKAQILERYKEERAFYESKPWLQPDRRHNTARSRPPDPFG